LPGSDQKESMKTKELPVNLEEMLDLKAIEKIDNEIMDNLISSNEDYPDEIFTFEDNLEFLRSSKSSIRGNTDNVMSSTLKKEVKDEFKLVLGTGSDNVNNRTQDSGREKEKNSRKVNENYNLFNLDELIYKCENKNKPSIYAINPEDFPLNLSESSSEENAGTKSVSNGSRIIFTNNKRSLSESSSDDESNLIRENVNNIPTIRGKSVSYRSRKISSINQKNTQLKVNERNNWYKRRNKRLSESSSEEDDGTFSLVEIPPEAVSKNQQQIRYRKQYGDAKKRKFDLQHYRT